MKLSELLVILERMKRENGDIDVCVETLSHTWAPEPKLTKRAGKPVVLLNP